MRVPLKKVSYASILLSLLAAAGVTALTTPRRPQEQEPRQSQEPRKVFMPKRFLSEVKNLKVERHWIEDAGTDEAHLVVVIRNKSYLAATHVSVTFGEITVSRDGGIDFEEPRAVIEPYGTVEFSIPVTNFNNESPFVISAALYTDGTEDGREQQVRWAHKDREEGRAKHAAKKGGPEQ
jgi:hypothetical protein